jgi:hypothetical protein
MAIVSHLHHLFNTEHVKLTSMRCAGKIGPCNAPDVRATTSAPGGRITTSLD